MNKYKIKRYLILTIIFVLTISISAGMSIYQNYLYYSTLEKNYKTDQIKYLDTITYYYSDCMLNNSSNQTCQII